MKVLRLLSRDEYTALISLIYQTQDYVTFNQDAIDNLDKILKILRQDEDSEFTGIT